MSEQTEPLSEARLAEIRQRVSQAEDHRANGYMLLTGEFGYALDGRALLDELDQLRAELEAYRAYIETMAAFSPIARLQDVQRKIIEARALVLPKRRAGGREE